MKSDEIKKIFRGIRSTKKEMELRLAFLKDVQGMDFDTSGIEASILREYAKLEQKIQLADRMLDTLEPDERAVLTARYYEGIRWEYIEPVLQYSISQCQRIHNRAIRKLMSFSDGEGKVHPTKEAKMPMLPQHQ